MTPASARQRRLIDDAVLGRLAARRRPQLLVTLRGSEPLRHRYDRGVEAMRALEQRDIAEHELDLVEQWLFEDVRASDPATERGGWLRLLAVALAVGAGLLLALGPLRPSVQSESDVLTPKGSTGAPLLAIEALCARPGARLVPAASYGCDLQGSLSFAYRLDPAAPTGVLTLFGIDEHGDVLYYQPTPVDHDPIQALSGSWQPLPMAVQLHINHEAGEVTLYGLVSPEGLTIADIDEAAAALRGAHGQGQGVPWHRRLRGRVGALCATPGACESAQVSFRLHEDAP